jgi:hypothetical protein
METLLALRSSRARRPKDARPSYQYKVQLQNLDALYNICMTERQLRDVHPEIAPSFIAACDKGWTIPA